MNATTPILADLRSDTVTRPTDAMWEAMRSAPLGDDVLGDEPTVQELESRIADLLGKEAGLFTPSGTMANQLAIRAICEGGDEIVAHRENHIIHYETGGPAALSGCMIEGLDGDGGVFDANALEGAIRHADVHHPRTRFVAVENSHNRGGGTVWRLDEFESVSEVAKRRDLHVHVDGEALQRGHRRRVRTRGLPSRRGHRQRLLLKAGSTGRSAGRGARLVEGPADSARCSGEA